LAPLPLVQEVWDDSGYRCASGGCRPRSHPHQPDSAGAVDEFVTACSDDLADLLGGVRSRRAVSGTGPGEHADGQCTFTAPDFVAGGGVQAILLCQATVY